MFDDGEQCMLRHIQCTREDRKNFKDGKKYCCELSGNSDLWFFKYFGTHLPLYISKSTEDKYAIAEVMLLYKFWDDWVYLYVVTPKVGYLEVESEKFCFIQLARCKSNLIAYGSSKKGRQKLRKECLVWTKQTFALPTLVQIFLNAWY